MTKELQQSDPSIAATPEIRKDRPSLQRPANTLVPPAARDVDTNHVAHPGPPPHEPPHPTHRVPQVSLQPDEFGGRHPSIKEQV